MSRTFVNSYAARALLAPGATAVMCAAVACLPQPAGAALVGQATPAPNASASPASAASAAPDSGGGPPSATQNQQTAPKRNPESPAQQASAPPTFNGAMGDLGGARTKLAEKGFTFNGHIVSEFAGNATGGIPIGGTATARGTALSTEVGVGFDADLGKLTHSGAGIVHALVTTRFGSSLSTNVLGNLISVQEIYGDGQTTRFTFLDYEQPLLDHKLDVVLGKINQQNDFIAGPSYWGGNLYCFYQNNNICGTPAGIPTNNGVTPAGSAGYNYYPSSMWGVRVKASPNKNVYIQAAALQANPIVNTNHGGAYFGFYGSTGTELPFEIGITLRNAAGDGVGDVRVGGYYDTSNVFRFSHDLAGQIAVVPPTDPLNDAIIASLPQDYVRGRDGTYIQLDHMLEGSSQADGRGTAAFVNAQYSDPATALLSTFVDAGLVRHGTFKNRPHDTVALGFSTANYNPRLQQLQSELQSAGFLVPYSGSEKAFELNYGWQASKWLLVRPGFQYVLDPNGGETNTPAGLIVPKSALVFGLTTTVSF